MFKLILALFLVFGLTVSTKVQAMASLRDRKDVQIPTELKDSCIKNVVFNKDNNLSLPPKTVPLAISNPGW